MEDKKTSLLYKIIKGLVWFFYPKLKVVGSENLPKDGAIIVGNHTQMNGPIAAELYCPGKHYTWCAGQMMELKEEPEEKPGFFADLFGGGEPEEDPAPMPCPYCGGEMERMYLVSGRGLVRLAKGKPGVVLGFAETVPLKDGEGFYHNWMTYWKTCRACTACRKLVVDVPEIDGAWSAEPPAETPDEAADEAYQRYLEQLKHYQ